MIKYTEASDIGLVRSNNEDSILSLPPTFVVADGMGGHAAGEIASRILVYAVRAYAQNKNNCLDQEDLRIALLNANQNILNSIEAHPEQKGMGTTATVLHIAGNRARWAHVGDSRLYLLRHGELRKITRDHTYVEDLLSSGSISPLEATNHPNRNFLTRAIGVEELLMVDTGDFKAENGDTFLLCSDGLTNMVPEDAIANALRDRNNANKAEALVKLACDDGGRDNISAIVVEYYEE